LSVLIHGGAWVQYPIHLSAISAPHAQGVPLRDLLQQFQAAPSCAGKEKTGKELKHMKLPCKSVKPYCYKASRMFQTAMCPPSRQAWTRQTTPTCTRKNQSHTHTHTHEPLKVNPAWGPRFRNTTSIPYASQSQPYTHTCSAIRTAATKTCRTSSCQRLRENILVTSAY
jgi:hypothetical protein